MRATKIRVNFACEIGLGLPSKITRSSSTVAGNMQDYQSRGRKINVRFSGLSSPVYICLVVSRTFSCNPTKMPGFTPHSSLYFYP